MTANEIMEKLIENDKNGTLIEMAADPLVMYTVKTDRETGEPRIFYINCSTSERSFDIDDVVDTTKPFKLVQRQSNYKQGYSFAYDEKLDMLVIFIARLDTSMIWAGETRYWMEQKRIYIDREKRVYAKSAMDGKFKLFERYPSYDVFGFISIKQGDCMCPVNMVFPSESGLKVKLPALGSGMAAGLFPDIPSMDAVWKVFPKAVTLAANKTLFLNSKHALLSFLRYKEPEKKNNGKQKRIDELVGYGAEDPCIYSDAVDDRIREAEEGKQLLSACKTSRTHELSVLERITCDKPVVCLRKFIFSSSEKELYECSRIYFSDKEAFACKSDNKGGFTYMPMYDNATHWMSPIVNYDPAVTEGTMLKYFTSIIDSIPHRLKGFYIWALVKMPVLEMMWKAGYVSCVKSILNQAEGANLKDVMESIFGTINLKAKNINGILGLNKHQLDVLLNAEEFTNPHYYSVGERIYRLKCMLTETPYRPYYIGKPYLSIQDINPETFDMAVGFVNEIIEKRNKNSCDSGTSTDGMVYAAVGDVAFYTLRCANSICEVWGVRVLFKSMKSLMMICDNAIKMIKDNADEETFFLVAGSYLDNIQLLSDYIDIVNQTNVKDSNKPYFQTEDDLRRMHDNIVTISMLKKNKQKSEQIKKAAGRVAGFEYENGDYRIITPVSPEDFLLEGQELNHCVGNYVHRVAAGSTNVMFIRRQADPDKPFFTVEISDKGNIEQIHGFNNRNLDTEPDLIPFIEEWIKRKKVRLHGIDKIR